MNIGKEAIEARMPKNEYAYRAVKAQLDEVEFISGLYQDDPVAQARKEAHRHLNGLLDRCLKSRIVLDSTIEKAQEAVKAAQDAVDAFKRDPARVAAALKNEREWHEEDMRELDSE